MRERDATDTRVEAILRQVDAARPTDSRIELVTPRRPRPTLARQPEAGSQTPSAPRRQNTATPPPATPVPTEIGPLPADLWTLLGETPPASTAPPPPVIMRSVDTAPAPAPQLAPAAPAPAPDASPTADAEDGINVDELARRVYDQLKRRLSTDWERTRRVLP